MQEQEAQKLSDYEARGRCAARGEQLRQQNPQAHKTITDNLSALYETLSAEQQQALEAALTYNTDAVWQLGLRLSDDSDGTTMADKMYLVQQASPQEILQAAQQGASSIQQEKYIQARVMQALAANGKRISSAPPPMSVPRGGATPPRDLYRTAEKSDASDYIKMRRAQMARDDQFWHAMART